MERLYEAMFVVHNDRARSDHEGVVKELTSMIERAGGKLVNLDKWEERRLAYQIHKHKRATYYLSHFDAPPDAVAKLERMCRLSDWVLRALVVRDEDGTAIGPAYEYEDAAQSPAPRFRKASSEGERGDGGRERAGSGKVSSTGPSESPAASPVVGALTSEESSREKAADPPASPEHPATAEPEAEAAEAEGGESASPAESEE